MLGHYTSGDCKLVLLLVVQYQHIHTYVHLREPNHKKPIQMNEYPMAHPCSLSELLPVMNAYTYLFDHKHKGGDTGNKAMNENTEHAHTNDTHLQIPSGTQYGASNDRSITVIRENHKGMKISSL